MEDNSKRLLKWKPTWVIFGLLDSMMIHPETELYLRVHPRHVFARNRCKDLLEKVCTVNYRQDAK